MQKVTTNRERFLNCTQLIYVIEEMQWHPEPPGNEYQRANSNGNCQLTVVARGHVLM